MGSVALTLCHDGLQAYCGSISRPLDPAGEVKGKIRIGFELFPHFDNTQPPLETIVAQEGGPGYPSTGSATGYYGLFKPLMERRDLLVVDARGTGLSQALDCPAIQHSDYLFIAGITACGEQLGDTSDLYGSGLAADDMAAVLDALGIGQIDLYGDSYGTYFSQTFAGRHPERLRSLVLDSAYPVVGLSPWYPEAAPAMRNAFEKVCEQSLSCRDIPGDTLKRIETLLNDLRAHPFTGKAHDGEGNLIDVTADAHSLGLLAFGNSTGPVVYRETDAAARAYIEQGNSAPLLRLFAENQVISQSGAPPWDPKVYSAALFTAVSCQDYPFVYDLTKPTSVRWQQREAAFAKEQENDPGVYAPFTLKEFDALPLDFSVFDTCLTWPIPSQAHPPGQPVPPGAKFTTAPVLVLSGLLDSLTPARQGFEATKEFENAQQVLVANSFHVTAVDEQDNCASLIVQNFVSNLEPGDISCAAKIAEVRTVPRFVTSFSQLDPSTATPGNQGTIEDLKIAAAATLTAGDTVARWWMNSSGSGVELYGGTFQYNYNSTTGYYDFQLTNSRWVKDVAVTGKMTWTYVKPGTVSAVLTVRGPNGESGVLNIAWNDREQHAQARITGQIGGRTIAATMYAP
jgi:pimeloyl-ACP methyl ester carboxylesterase